MFCSQVLEMDALFGSNDQILRTSVTATYLGYLIAAIYASFNLDVAFTVIIVCLSAHFFFLLAGMIGSICNEGWWPYDPELTGIELSVVLKVWDAVQLVVLVYAIIVMTTDHSADDDNKIFSLLVVYVGVFLCFFKFIRLSQFFEGNRFFYGLDN